MDQAVEVVEAAREDRPVRHIGGPPERPAAAASAPVQLQRELQGRASLALSNLRGLVIVVVLAFHSFLAYLGWLSASAAPFDAPPFQWRAFPIVDSHRWFGFDIFCAWQDVYLMSLMFFMSALFTWPSLTRKGDARFLRDRFQRLGVPFLFGVLVVIPIAEYPAFRVTAADPSLHAYVADYLSLPFVPNGPMWFLWQLLALTVAAAALHRFAPGPIEKLARWSADVGNRPRRYFLALAAACAVAYVPLALLFTPWSWTNHGPLGLQFSRPLLYGVFYLSGLALGANGLGRGLLSPDGPLARRWTAWLGSASGLFLAWMALTGLSINETGGGPLLLRVLVDLSFVLACASGCLAALALCLRFAVFRSRSLASLSANAYGIYLLHYPFVVWLQYALLGVALFALGKATIVLGLTLLLSWTIAVGLSFVPLGCRLIGVERRGPKAVLPALQSPSLAFHAVRPAARQPTKLAG